MTMIKGIPHNETQSVRNRLRRTLTSTLNMATRLLPAFRPCLQRHGDLQANGSLKADVADTTDHRVNKLGGIGAFANPIRRDSIQLICVFV